MLDKAIWTLVSWLSSSTDRGDDARVLDGVPLAGALRGKPALRCRSLFSRRAVSGESEDRDDPSVQDSIFFPVLPSAREL